MSAIASAKRTQFKRMILRKKLLPYVCALCKREPEWEGKSLTLQLDHINGNSTDNRLENVRFLCPNCHSQTENFGGSSNRKLPKHCECGVEIHRNSKGCSSCQAKERQRKRREEPASERFKIEWPPIDELLRMVKETSCLQVARQLGVSDVAVAKHIKNYS